MPIHIADPAPGGALDAVARLATDPRAVHGLPQNVAGEVSASEGYPVFYVGVDELAEGGGLDLAGRRPEHWRHLLVRGGEVLGEADVAEEEDGPRVVAFHTGPRAGGTVRGLEAVHEAPEARGLDLALSLLEAPGIYLVALRLEGGGEELLVAVDPDRTGLPLYRPLPMAEALPVLRERAAEVLRHQAERPGPSGA